MECGRVKLMMILFGAVLSIQLVSVYSAEKCLSGVYHKPAPSPEGPDYAECFSWKNKSCCNAKLTIELKKNNVENLWNFTWNHCGNLSKECERFTKDEECFFQCEPSLIKWRIGEKADIKGVPICSKYCDDWYTACKYDMTCVADWTRFNYTSSTYTCPLKSTCQTFEKVYGSGEALCNKQWGSSFRYENSSNCMVMRFSGPNPNEKVIKVVQLGNTVTPSVVLSFIGIFLVYSIL